MSTNKQHATLCIRDKPSLTSHVDYVNRYPSVLQTTSYNFPSTKTTGEICVGVVKAQKRFPKNPAQHLADLVMVEQKPEVKPAFLNSKTGKKRTLNALGSMALETRGHSMTRFSIGGPSVTYRKEIAQCSYQRETAARATKTA